LTGFWKLARGIVRRDRVRLLVWLVAVPAVTIPSLGAYGEMFETPQSAAARAALMATPTGTVFGGPGYGLDHYTTGAMIANELLLWLNLTVALAAILLVVHMTRREEETGRLELVGAAAVGRQAPLAAALAVAGAEVALIGLALGLGCLVYPDLGLGNCLAFGLAIAANGLAFLAVGAVAAQIASTGRAAGGLASACLGLAFLARAAGDWAAVRGEPDWASWLSPLGWAARTRVFVDLRWWPILLMVAFALVVGAVAWRLAARRDAGAGLVPARPGPAAAAKSLANPSGLVWRRTRGSFLGWAGGATLLALAMGPVMGSLGGYLEDNPLMAEVLGVDPQAGLEALTEGFSGVIVLYTAMLMGAYAITALNQLRADELAGLAARALAEPVSRLRLLGASQVTVGACALMGMSLAGIAYCAVVAGDSSMGAEVAGNVAASVLRAFPALVATVALASCLAAGFPRLAALSWAPFAYAFAHMILGQVLGFPAWTRFLSQFTAVPLSPGADFEWGPALVLLALAAGLFWLAHRRFRARDLLA
jgi:ABC-2 type transport system permease protein